MIELEHDLRGTAPDQAYRWSEGRAVFASGSPFSAVQLDDGRTLYPAQGNNAYVFPGIGLGAIGDRTTNGRISQS